MFSKEDEARLARYEKWMVILAILYAFSVIVSSGVTLCRSLGIL